MPLFVGKVVKLSTIYPHLIHMTVGVSRNYSTELSTGPFDGVDPPT